MGGACSMYGGKRCIQAFGGEPEGDRSLERYRCRWDDNVPVVMEVGWMHRLYSSTSG